MRAPWRSEPRNTCARVRRLWLGTGGGGRGKSPGAPKKVAGNARLTAPSPARLPAPPCPARRRRAAPGAGARAARAVQLCAGPHAGLGPGEAAGAALQPVDGGAAAGGRGADPGREGLPGGTQHAEGHLLIRWAAPQVAVAACMQCAAERAQGASRGRDVVGNRLRWRCRDVVRGAAIEGTLPGRSRMQPVTSQC